MDEGLGSQHPSQPVTAADKVMSERHKRHRRLVASMNPGIAKEQARIYYHKNHSKEHQKELKKAEKRLVKLQKERGLKS